MFRLVLAFAGISLLTHSVVHALSQKPRVLVLTDIGGDPDDRQSLVRLLLYSNELDIEGICSTSRLEHGQDTRPDIIREQIEGYGQVLPNLLLHSTEYPSRAYLLNNVKVGLGNMREMGKGFSSEASDWIIHVTDRPDPRPLWITVWGGSRELAQALWQVRDKRSDEEINEFVSKLRVYFIGDQDGHRRWILQHFPELFTLSAGFASMGTQKVIETAVYRGQYMTGDHEYDKDWIKKNITTGHGPLGMLYPETAPGASGMKEGDTPSYNGLVHNGLNFPEHPEWGGWGGRFRRLRDNLYIDASDFAFGDWNERHTVSRWRSCFQRDFQARMDWCTQPFSKTNHKPNAAVNKDKTQNYITIEATPGSQVILDAAASSDPDKNKLYYSWWIYHEPSRYVDAVPIKGKTDSTATITIPADAGGKTLHLILEVTDDGSPALTGFRRILIHVK